MGTRPSCPSKLSGVSIKSSFFTPPKKCAHLIATFHTVNLSKISSALLSTVSEESSYSSDNTEPEDDCRGCQLQWRSLTFCTDSSKRPQYVASCQLKTSSKLPKLRMRERRRRKKKRKPSTLFRKCKRYRSHWSLSKARPGLFTAPRLKKFKSHLKRGRKKISCLRGVHNLIPLLVGMYKDSCCYKRVSSKLQI